MADSLIAGSSDRPYLSLVIPAYNEESRIADTIARAVSFLETLGKSWELIVVDDGSTDDTLQGIRSSQTRSTQVRLVSYTPNRGKGYAVRQGVEASRGEYVAFSDADLSAPLEELPKLFNAMARGYDVVIGSRAVQGAHLGARQPRYRELGGKGLNLIIQALAVPGIRDTQCGFKLFRGDAAREIFSRCFVAGWGFDVEVLFLARRLGYTIAEVGVEWSHAEASKIHPFRAALRVIWDVLRVRAHRYAR